MYKDFWKLRELPFDNTPNTKYFYASEKHQEALSRLLYLVREKRPGGLLTGVYGCGKTLVLQSLKNATVSEGYKYSVIVNPRLDDLGILRLILRGLISREVSANKADVLMELQQAIENVAQDGKHTVIVIDEAHAIMDEQVFEELRLLMNFQTETRSLVTLLFVGQPELRPKVESNKQLNQRISLRFHLDAFSEEDTKKYVLHRLTVAGAGRADVFSPEALSLIHRHSGGIPRWINQYCNNSLLAGFGRQAKQVTPEIVEEAVLSLAGAV